MKNVLIIAHGFPPIGGVGVQRPYKFTQYLPDLGWNPIVLTQVARYSATWDESLLNLLEQRHTPIYRAQNPMMTLQYYMHKRKNRRDHASSLKVDRTIAQSVAAEGQSARRKMIRLLKGLRDQLLIPDAEIFWLPYAVAVGLRALQSHPIDAIYATSPPETSLLVAAILSQMTGVPLIADFRDPWVANLHRKESGFRHAIEKRLEGFVFARAARITTVTESFRVAFATRYPQYRDKIFVISNGYDASDLELPGDIVNSTHERMHIYYGGILYEKRSPTVFLYALARVLEQQPNMRDHIRVQFAGVFDYPGRSANRELVAKLGLEDVVEVIGYVAHADHMRYMARADLLLVIGDQTPEAAAYVPAKVYEYLGSGKPILGLIHVGEASWLVQECEAGRVVDVQDEDGAADVIHYFYETWVSGELANWKHHPLAKKYERKEQTHLLAEHLNAIVRQ